MRYLLLDEGAIDESAPLALRNLTAALFSRVEGEVAVLARLLSKRFGPLDEQTSARLKAATLDQLDIWADRILDAPTLQAVFDGH